MKARVAWGNARRFAEEDLRDPDDLWGAIAKFSASQWDEKWEKYRLHRFPKGHERVWRIARAIRKKPFYGDARKIWKGKDPEQVKEELESIRLGEQLTSMAVGALIDTGHLKGRNDVKADLHVRRVLGRILTGDTISEDDAIKITRKMFPRNPWRLDSALFQHGRSICKAKPKCSLCKLSYECVFYKKS